MRFVFVGIICVLHCFSPGSRVKRTYLRIRLDNVHLLFVLLLAVWLGSVNCVVLVATLLVIASC